MYKSLRLWSFYVDLEESVGTVESTKAVYDKILELKIANPQIIVNYANFLEENKYFEDSYKVYERGIDLFGYPIAFELWNTYLLKFMERYVSCLLASVWSLDPKDIFSYAFHCHIDYREEPSSSAQEICSSRLSKRCPQSMPSLCISCMVTWKRPTAWRAMP